VNIRRIRWLTQLAFGFLVFLPCLAGNEHEHLQYFPTFDDIRSAMKGQLEKKRTSELLSKDLDEINSRFGPGILTEDEFLNLRKTKNFEEFCTLLSEKLPGKSPLQVMQDFFECNSTHADALRSYGNAGSIRSKLFQNSQKMVEPAILAALNHSPRFQVRKCVFTVPTAQVDAKLLRNLAREFESRKMQAQFYTSISRQKLSNPHQNFERQVELLQRGSREGWLHGVDISGSLWDSISDYDQPAEDLMRIRLKRIFEASSEAGFGIRIHAFEHGKQGGFYNALWDALRECKKEGCTPPALRIGHISDLDPESLNRLLKWVPKKNLIFEVNAESNLRLLGPTSEDLIERIERLHTKGLRVAMGSDGVGILGTPSRFDATLARFKWFGMSDRSLQKLLQEAYTPLRGSRHSEAILAKWAQEKELMDSVVARLPRGKPVSSSCSSSFIERLRNLFH